jgi:aminoglycoside phosphotransferase (APT) family kinase protein
MLEQSDIAHYLLSLGLVKPRDVVEDGIRIVDASRRNKVFVATTPNGPAFVVKQAGERSAGTLAHEAAVLAVLGQSADLAGRVPAVAHYQPADALLVLATPGGARGWIRDGRFPSTPARQLGRLLGELHRLPHGAVDELPRGVDRMWGLSLTEPPHELVLDLSAGAQDLVARLQSSSAACRRLEELHESVAGDALVHGDVRLDNCLVLPAPGSRRGTGVLLVDWELAGRGSAASDAGTVLAEYLAVWVGSIPIVAPADPARLIARARHPLRGMWPAIHAFWSAYAAAGSPHPPLRRVVELAAVRLLQTAVEYADSLAAASAHVVTLMQLADNMLREPDEAALSLLGLRA